MVSGIIASSIEGAWILTLLTLIIFVFAVILTSAAMWHLHYFPEDHNHLELKHAFGSMLSCFATLFQAVSGGISYCEPIQILADTLGMVYVAILLLCCFHIFCRAQRSDSALLP